MLPVEQPFKAYTGLDGKPLNNGSVYFGQPGQDPITHPVTVYWDAAGTQPAAQPLPTMNGYIVNGSGSAANVFCDSSYSMSVLDSKGRQVFYAQTSDSFSLATFVSSFTKPSGAGKIGAQSSITGAVTRTVQAALQDVVSLAAFGSIGDGIEIALNNLAWKSVESYVNNFPSTTFAPIGVFIPDGVYKYSYTPTFTRPVRIFSNGGAVLNYTGSNEVMVFGNKAQTGAAAGTNDYYEVDNICFTGAADASDGLYFANWVLQPKVTNCRFLNFGSSGMYALTFQGNNWSIDVNDNRYLVTDDPGFARHWCRVLGVSKTTSAGTVTSGQVVNGSYDGSNSRLNALNNWVRFGGGQPGVGYIVTGTKSRIVGGGVENPSIGVFFDGTGITIFDAEVSMYCETPKGTAVFQAAGNVAGLNIHDVYANLHNDSFYNSTAKFFITAGSVANVTSSTFRDLVVLNASKYPLVTLRDAQGQYGNSFGGRTITNAPLFCAMANNYWMWLTDYRPAYHNTDLLGGLDTSITAATTTQARISSRLRVSAGASIGISVAAVAAPNSGIPPCRNRHFSLSWSSTLAVGNYIALEARMDDLSDFSGGIATGGIVARYVNNGGPLTINATLQLGTIVGGIPTVIATKAITLDGTLRGFALPQVINAVKGADGDCVTMSIIIQGAGHTGTSGVEIVNMDVAEGEYPPPVLSVDRPRQVATANQWYRRINSSVSQSGNITTFPVQIGTGWATAVRNIKQISLTGPASASIVASGDSSVYVQPSPASPAFDIVFSVEAES